MKELKQEIQVSAPPRQVFQALTDAREIERWWTTKARSEPRKDGGFRYDWTFPEAPERDHVQEGRYIEFEDGSRVSYPWKVGDRNTEVDFTVDGNGAATRLVMEHRGWAPGMEEAYERHDQGWRFFLGNLKSYLEEKVDRRAEMGLEVGG